MLGYLGVQVRDKLILVVLISFFLSQCLLLHYFIPLFIFIIAGFIWLILRHPEVALFVVVVAANDFFSLISEDIFRLPGVFRFKDLLFIFTYLVLFLQILQRKISLKRSLFSRAIWLVLFFVILEVFLTMFLRQQNFNYTIRMGRRYLYYLLYFPLVYLINDDKKFNRFLNLILGATVIYSLLIITQYILGSSHVLFRFASHLEEQKIAGEYVTRTYAAGVSLAVICFYFFFYRILLEKKQSWVNFTVLILTFFSGVYLTFGRANLFGVAAGFIFSFFILLNGKLKIRALLITLTFGIVLLSTFEIIRVVSGKDVPNPITHSFKALLSGVEDLRNKTGTFGFRLKDSVERIDLIKKNSVTGIGFVHPLSGIIKIRADTSGIVTADSGLITLLLDFGMLGIIWLIFLTLVFFKKTKKLYFETTDIHKKVIVIAAFSYFFSRLFSFLTLTEFVNQGGIVSLIVTFFILNYIEVNKDGYINNNR